MDKELEKAKKYLEYKVDKRKQGRNFFIDYEEEFKHEQTILNYIENSIPTSVVEEKIKKKKEEREEYWSKNEIMLNFTHDKKKATISLEELKINDKSMELLGEIKCLQELLEKGEK